MLVHELLDAGLILLIIFAFGMLLSIKQWSEWFRRTLSASWPMTSGTVESGVVSTTQGQNRESATAELSYSYELNGRYFSGYHSETFGDEQKAWSYVDSLKGHPVQISYNPRKPEISVLRR
jgi:hypothetical protein